MRVKRFESQATRQLKEADAAIKRVADLPAELPDAFAAEAAAIRALRVYRQDFTVTLKFALRADGAMEVDVTLTFKVANLLGVAYPFTHSLEVLPDQVEQVSRLLQAAATGNDLDSMKDQYDLRFDAGAPVFSFERHVRVRPTGKTPANQFESRFRRLMRASDAEVIYFVQPTLNATVVVEEKPENLAVTVEFGHRNAGNATMLPARERPVRWQLNEAFLPWQSLSIQWHMKSPAGEIAARGSSTAS